MKGIGNVPKWDPPVRKKPAPKEPEVEDDKSEANLIKEGDDIIEDDEDDHKEVAT